jgi:hypothetical protein
MVLVRKSKHVVILIYSWYVHRCFHLAQTDAPKIQLENWILLIYT